MKKRLMMVAVLIGALSLSACVDNVESDSVTAVRTAKAAQLNGLAALANAQAEAEKIMAQAEVALRNAEIEFQKQQTEQSKQQFAIEIERIKAEADLAIARAKQATSEAELAILQNASLRVQWLYGQYRMATGNLVTLNTNLLTRKSGLARLEAGIVTAEANAKVNMIALNKTISGENAKIEVLKDPANQNIDQNQLWAKVQTADQKYRLAWSKLATNEGAALRESATTVSNAVNALDTKTIDAANSFGYRVVQYTSSSNENYYNFDDGGWQMRSVLIYKGAFVNQAAKLSAERSFGVTEAAEKLGASTDAKDKNTAYGYLAAAKYQLDQAKALPDDTEAEKDIKKNAIDAANMSIAQQEVYLVTCKADHEKAVAGLAKFTAAVAALNLPAYETAVNAIQALIAKNITVYEGFDKASEASTKLWQEYSALYALYSDGLDIQALIAQSEVRIATAKEQLESWKENVANVEAQVVMEKETIANLENEIAAQKIIVEKAKAALDAELKAE